MAGNTFGRLFCITTFGESHGPAIGCIVDGCPAGLSIDTQDLQVELDKRRPGQSHYTTQRQESDQVQILSGVFEGKTTGTPIALLIPNEDARSRDYEKLKDVFRPGHGDFTYFKKYGIRDHRGGGRSSARETAARVAAGAIAKKYLREKLGMQIRGYVAQIGSIQIDPAQFNWDDIARNPFFCPDASKVTAMEDLITQLRREGDSVGARVNVQVDSVPTGLGEPVFDRLDAELARALMSINAVKGVEVGDGFAVVAQKGSEHRDEMTSQGFNSNHSGGILAGISTGQPLFMSVAFKPTSSIVKVAHSINQAGDAVEVSTTGRHDPCVGIRGVAICEAMVALTLMDQWLHFKHV